MAINPQSFTLDLSKSIGEIKVLRLGQGDYLGTHLTTSITENGTAFALDEYSVFLEILLPGQTAYVRQQGTAEGNQAQFDIDETKLTTSGVTDVAYISIEKDGEIIASTERFRVIIEKSAKDAKPAQSWVSEIDRAAQNLAAAQDGVDVALEAAQSAAQGFSEAKTAYETAKADADAAAGEYADAATANEAAKSSYQAAAAKYEEAASKRDDAATILDDMEQRYEQAEGARQDTFDSFMAERVAGDYVTPSQVTVASAEAINALFEGGE